MSTTTLERSPAADSNEPYRFDLSQEYVDSVFASMTTPLIAEGIGQNIPQDAIDTTRSPEVFVAPEGAPTGFPTTEQAEAEIAAREQLGDMKFSLKQLAKSGLGAPTYLATVAYGKLYDKSLKNWNYFQSKSVPEQQAHIERMGRLGGIVGWVGVTGLALTVVSRATGFDPMHAFNSLYDHPKTVAYTDPNQIKLANVTAAIDTEGQHGVSQYDLVTPFMDNIHTFKYDPALDPGAAISGKHHNDFGVALQPSPMDAKKHAPAGLYDLVHDRWARSPKELATVLSKMGQIPNDAASINKIADGMTDPKNGPIFFQQGYKTALDILAHSRIEEKPITSAYGSYYIVDDGHGHLTIAYDPYVDHPENRGTMFVITTPEPNSKTIYLRKECGGQPIDFIPTSPEVQHYAAAQNQPAYVPEKHTSTPHSETPSTPNHPSTPDTPNTPDTPDTPDNPNPPVNPEEHKTDQYQKDPNRSRLGSGNFENVPKPVERDVTSTGQEGIAQAPIKDNHKVQPHTETGGASGSTHHDAPLGKPGVSGTADTGTHSGAVSGPQ